jgi:anti-sigma factor RsiW
MIVRCEQFHEILEEGRPPYPSAFEDHLRRCPTCAADERDWRSIRSGLFELAQEAAPEPSLGFVTRLIRQLEEGCVPLRLVEEFFETAGRRVIYSTLLLATVLLLAIALPATGPLRSRHSTEVSWPQPEIVATRDYPIPPSELPGSGFSLTPENFSDQK